MSALWQGGRRKGHWTFLNATILPSLLVCLLSVWSQSWQQKSLESEVNPFRGFLHRFAFPYFLPVSWQMFSLTTHRFQRRTFIVSWKLAIFLTNVFTYYTQISTENIYRILKLAIFLHAYTYYTRGRDHSPWVGTSDVAYSTYVYNFI